jgi:hypothetical protein
MLHRTWRTAPQHLAGAQGLLARRLSPSACERSVWFFRCGDTRLPWGRWVLLARQRAVCSAAGFNAAMRVALTQRKWSQDCRGQMMGPASCLIWASDGQTMHCTGLLGPLQLGLHDLDSNVRHTANQSRKADQELQRCQHVCSRVCNASPTGKDEHTGKTMPDAAPDPPASQSPRIGGSTLNLACSSRVSKL